jgi:hypothetical protein
MNKFKFWFLGIVVLFGCRLSNPFKISNSMIESSKNIPILSKNKNCNYELIMCMSALRGKAEKIVVKNKIVNAQLINMGFVDREDKGCIDEIKLTQVIEKLFPDTTKKYIGIFDWEGKAFDDLVRLPAENIRFQQVIKEYIKVCYIAKKLRPNVRFGFYALPIRNYWNPDDKWRKENLKLIPLLKEVDVLFPSIYDFYKDSDPNAGFIKDHVYVHTNVAMAIQFGKQFNIPVFPVVWHRWLNAEEHGGNCLIPLEEFIPHIKAALSVNDHGTKINGLVWWGEDSYFLQTKTKALIREVATKPNFETYEYEIIKSYSKAIYKAFEEQCDSIKN